MSDIGARDYVESLFDFPRRENLMPVTKGTLYCVAVVDTELIECTLCGDDGPGFFLVGDVVTRHSGWTRCVCEVRPVYRPSATIIETLKRPVCEPVKEPA